MTGHPCFKTTAVCEMTKNLVAFTLGYTRAADNNVTDFAVYLSKLTEDLQFVSILEQKLESMLLLKRKMCWNIKDILHIHTHLRTLSSDTNMSLEDMHREYSTLDYYIYDHFARKLEGEIADEGEDFVEELEEYATLQKTFTKLCQQLCYDLQGLAVANVAEIRSVLQREVNIPETKYNAGFSISYIDCLWAMAPEYIIKIMVKLKQYPNACMLMDGIGLTPADCDFDKHVYPGYHIKIFKTFFLNKAACLDNKYNDL